MLLQTVPYIGLNQKKWLLVPQLWFACSRGKILFPKCVAPITTELKMEIPHGYFGKIYPRSNILKRCFVSCDVGVIDSDFRGSALILMTSNSKDPILIKPGQRIAQIIFHKREEVVFKKLIVWVEQKEELEVLVQQGFNFL